jgi:CRP-like cAMP-binding protein
MADLPVDHLRDLESCKITGLYRPRQVVFHEGTPASGLWILCHGTVKLYQSDRFGRDFIIDVVTPGALLGEFTLDEGAPYSASAEALTEAQLSFLPRERLARLLQRHPQTAVRLVAALSEALAATRRKAGGLALKRAEARLADLLLRLAGEAGPGRTGDRPRRVRLTYSRRELAEMIGVSTETAIRLLSKLKRNHVVGGSEREIVILDLERLTRLAHHGALVA